MYYLCINHTLFGPYKTDIAIEKAEEAVDEKGGVVQILNLLGDLVFTY